MSKILLLGSIFYLLIQMGTTNENVHNVFGILMVLGPNFTDKIVWTKGIYDKMVLKKW